MDCHETSWTLLCYATTPSLNSCYDRQPIKVISTLPHTLPQIVSTSKRDPLLGHPAFNQWLFNEGMVRGDQVALPFSRYLLLDSA